MAEKNKNIGREHFRRVMGRFATGVTVITASANGETRGMTANAFMSGSLNPPLCVVSVAKHAHMHSIMLAADRYAINFLAEGQEQVADHFARRTALQVPLETVDGIPVLVDASARILADASDRHDCGDHTLFIGEIKSMLADDRPPLVYHAARYGGFEPLPEGQAQAPDIW